MRTVLGVLALLLLAAPCFSQGNAEIVHAKPIRLRHLAGTIVDPAGMTVEYGQVELRDPKDHHVLASTFADAKGNFSFQDRKRGQRFEIEILAKGFNPSRYTVRMALFGRGKLRARMVDAT